jgi:O-antigen/teichoic acid export membrane protein
MYVLESVSRLKVITGAITVPAVIGGAWLAGVEGAVGGSVVALAVQCVLNQRVLAEVCAQHGIRTAGLRARDELPVLHRFALPAFLSSVVSMPVWWASNVLLVNRAGGYEEMAVLGAAYQWRNLLLFVPTVMGQFITPIVTERLRKGSRDSAGEALRVAMVVATLTAVPAALVLSAASPWIMSAYGEGFHSGWPVLVIVLATSALLAVQTPVGSIIAASGRMWMGALMNLGWAVVMLASTLWLLPLGARGVAAAALLAYCIHGAWTFWFAWRVLAPRSRTHE